ncbi:putative Rho-GTPase-activating protein [Triangularia verruculosa]|uniref:Rho-GTPase-activating protein n=1 Tax=Triangularia verruculosa TaxID=2587418 RepID=A0AAN6XHW9_9PEZI|nr:putative Rho-GTPase-activating protein [Triangularia verruculosa]
MTSAALPAPHPPVASQHQHQHQQQPSQHHQQRAPPSTPAAPTHLPSAVSPPSKRDLKSWWKGFKLPSKHQEANDQARPQGIFGVPLRQSITYANVAISLVDEDGKSYIYGYVPIVVAKCGIFLKERATEIEGIFRLSGSEKRIKELKNIFDSPDRYGKGLVWDGYTVHDAANVLRRYLNDLPEPVVPLDLYEKFREPLRGATRPGAGEAEGPQFVETFDMDAAIRRYQQLITELPPLNRQLLLYILDLLAVFAAKSDQNRMNSQNLAAIFQPGMLSHPHHAMAPEEYRLNQLVIIFLIENQDHFLIGMQGTGLDEKTAQQVQNPKPPHTPNRKSGVHRSASTASAGAESVRKNGSIRRNKSTSSRRSMASNGAPSPASPAVATTPTSGLNRSNTVPSKKSPALQAGRFGNRGEALVSPLTPVAPPATTVIPPPAVLEEVATTEEAETSVSVPAPGPETTAASGPRPEHLTVPLPGLSVPGQEKLLEPTTSAPEVTTPSKERKLPILFQRIATSDGEGGKPNKLRKKRIPGSANPSAHSSQASLSHSAAASPNTETPNPLETISSGSKLAIPGDAPAEPKSEAGSETTPQAPAPTTAPATAPATAPQPTATDAEPHQVLLTPNNAENTLKSKKSPPTSLNSSFNESSDMDQVDELTAVTSEVTSPESGEKSQKKRWRLSRKKEDTGPSYPPLSSPRLLGTHSNAETSTTSIGSSGYKQSMTGDSLDRALASGELSSGEGGGNGGKDKISSWIKNKYREHKENVEQRRNKSPPGGERTVSIGSSLMSSTRGKSLDLKRAEEENNVAGGGSIAAPTQAPPAVPQLPTAQSANTQRQQPQVQQPQPHNAQQ